MAIYHLENNRLSVSVDSHGAELRSLKRRSDDTEYMWNADPGYWAETSPVLFPFVGSLNHGGYRYRGKEYPMSKHGFAKDMEFGLLRQTGNELGFVLRADEETKADYPFDFELEIGYRLDEGNGNTLTVSWKVTNRGGQEMYFSIGGHPGFLRQPGGKGVQTDCRLLFDTGQGNDKIISSVVGTGSLLSERTREYALRDGMLDITEDLFEEDALVIEHGQAHKVSLCDAGGQPFVTVEFDAPLFALWAPVGKNVPFVCVEPWYGRCDRETFEGELPRREYGNRLPPYGRFYTEYTISVW